ncbi:MAG: site-specific integrase [Coriobacteriales bacterium]|jgi:integrase|nr:site-specific integrase [Coriobacteriales bacterium]
MRKVDGRGTISARGKNIWRIRLGLGRDPLTKKEFRSPWRTIHGTKADARRALEEYRQELEGGLRLDAAAITFGQFADMFHAERVSLGVISDNTIEKDKYLIRHLKDNLGSIPLQEIDAITIRSVYEQMATVEGKSPSVMHMTHTKLKQILDEAVKHDFIIKSPMHKITAPKKPESNRRSLTADELDRFTDCLSDREPDGYAMAVWLVLATGMRRAEALGLTWGCVDLENAHIDIRQTLGKNGKIHMGAKTSKSIRRVPIDPDTVKRLKEWKVAQIEDFLSWGIPLSSTSPVISNQVCGFISLDNMGRWWRSFCVASGFGVYVGDNGDELPPQQYNDNGFPVDKNGKPYSRANPKPKLSKHYEGLHLHGLRHTYASMLVANGVDFKTVQYLMGHASASTTLNLYSHVQEGQKRAASNLIGSLIKAEKPNAKVVNL